MSSAAEERDENPPKRRRSDRSNDLPLLSSIQDVQSFCDNESGKWPYDTIIFVPTEFSQWKGGGMIFDPQYSDHYADGRPVSLCTQYMAFLSSRQDNANGLKGFGSGLDIDIRCNTNVNDKVLYLFWRRQQQFPAQGLRVMKRSSRSHWSGGQDRRVVMKPNRFAGNPLPRQKPFAGTTLFEFDRSSRYGQRLTADELTHHYPIYITNINSSAFTNADDLKYELEADDNITVLLGPTDTWSSLVQKLSVSSGIPVEFLLIFGEHDGAVTNWNQLLSNDVVTHDRRRPEYKIRVVDKRLCGPGQCVKRDVQMASKHFVGNLR